MATTSGTPVLVWVFQEGTLTSAASVPAPRSPAAVVPTSYEQLVSVQPQNVQQVAAAEAPKPKIVTLVPIPQKPVVSAQPQQPVEVKLVVPKPSKKAREFASFQVVTPAQPKSTTRSTSKPKSTASSTSKPKPTSRSTSKPKPTARPTSPLIYLVPQDPSIAPVTPVPFPPNYVFYQHTSQPGAPSAGNHVETPDPLIFTIVSPSEAVTLTPPANTAQPPPGTQPSSNAAYAWLDKVEKSSSPAFAAPPQRPPTEPVYWWKTPEPQPAGPPPPPRQTGPGPTTGQAFFQAQKPIPGY